MNDTHQVKNQPKPLHNYNLYTSDPQIKHWLSQFGGDWGHDQVTQLGQNLGQPNWINKGFEVNYHTPEFQSHDAYGNRADLIKYHPGYHELMDLAVTNEIHAMPWKNSKLGAHVVRMALNYCYNQNEAGSACPLTMTFASIPSLQCSDNIAKHWIPKVLSNQYDSSNHPMQNKKGLTIGMAMTEKQGGTDVRANTSQAIYDGSDDWGERFLLTGHKWFCSAPMSDAFLTLAQTENGLSCLLMPRWTLQQNKNRIHIQRLKNKLGNRSNASSEIEFDHAQAWLLGQPGKGVPTIIQMVALTRYDCMIGSTALMRQAISQVMNHISQRKVMGDLLIDQPLMQNVVVDMALDWVGALALTARMANALDHRDDPAQQHFIRLMTAVGKYWICKQAISVTAEAAECMGGIGYTEEHITARLYREAPVNSIWEGSGNVQCLDVLRALKNKPDLWTSLINELKNGCDKFKSYDQSLEIFLGNSEMPAINPSMARFWVAQLAKLTQATLLIQYGDPQWAEAYCLGRLAHHNFGPYGQLPETIDKNSLIRKILNL